ncbi:sugar ABC transporter permease [Plantibacter sp. VKM Ac-2876]|nr:sugar ABC transporter permease [Plantibacter sp. VKM Ac-2876]MBF4564000.1 sugar ABC transporter permease [Plantibacter sp. VKM Ac-2876]OII39456.1 ABC transporter permease [Plantibacter sp. MMLR14_011]
MNIYYSLLNWKGGLSIPTFVGLDNYVALLSDEVFWLSFRNVGAMILALVIVPTVIGVLIAAVLFDYVGREFGSRAASFFRATYYLPQILPIAVAGIVWNWILQADDGAVNVVLRGLGMTDPPNWLGTPEWALPSIMLVLIWGQIGFPVVVFMGALQRVDPELYEAAELDGANWIARFKAITIPQIRPEIFVVSLTATIGALKVFGPIFVLTSGGPEGSTYVPSYYSYVAFFTLSRVGYGAAIANVLTLLTVVLAIFMIVWQTRTARKDDE